MITKELKELVKLEADRIKEFATAEEIKRLDFNSLDGGSYETCVYGQMTGDCWNQRANDLIVDCSVPFSELCIDYMPTKETQFKETQRSVFTAIEFYINQPEAKNENLIAYLKGETETLEL